MEAEALSKWEMCLQYLRKSLPKQVYDTWFTSLSCVEFTNNKLVIGAPTAFVVEYIEGQFLSKIREAIHAGFGTGVELHYKVVQPKDEEVGGEMASSVASSAQPSLRPAAGRQPLPPINPLLNAHYTFDGFVEGLSNKLALSVAKAIADKPGHSTFSPFFLYGASGVGKTHLANAIGVRVLQNYPQKRVLFVSAHQFQTQYTESVLRNKFNDFIGFYQTIDVLIVDDIQELTTQKTQQAFFHIFNHLQQNGRQIVMTCDRPPVSLEGLEERMLSRFKWGMVTELERPDIKLRRAILKSKIKRDGLTFPSAVIDHIAQVVDRSVRDLEGIVNSVMAYSIYLDSEIDIALTERVIARTMQVETKEVTVDDVVNAVAAHYGVKPRELSSKSRKQAVALARQVAMYLCEKYTGLSKSDIGRRIGNRDHSTVLYSCRQVERRVSQDKKFRHEIETIESKIKK